MRTISRWKRILGIGLAAGILASVTVTSVPVQASSIMDEVTELETTEDHAEATVPINTGDLRPIMRPVSAGGSTL